MATTKSKKVTTTSTKAPRTATKKVSTSNIYTANGLTVNPTKFSSGDKIKVTYNGLLSECGANEVYAHIGWGDSWEDVKDVKMSKTKSGFTATITAYNSALNICFKDTYNNWDNNNGNNYTVYCNN